MSNSKNRTRLRGLILRFSKFTIHELSAQPEKVSTLVRLKLFSSYWGKKIFKVSVGCGSLENQLIGKFCFLVGLQRLRV